MAKVTPMNKKKVGLGVGLGLAAAAASAAGYYFYASKDAAKNRKKVSKWATDMKSDVMAKAKKMKKFDQRVYKTIVDESMKAYKSVKSVDPKDLALAAAELKSNWKNVEAEISRVAKKDGVKVKKAVKKAVVSAQKIVAKAKSTAKKAVAKKKT